MVRDSRVFRDNRVRDSRVQLYQLLSSAWCLGTSHLQITGCIQQQIARLQVTMQNIGRVDVL